MKIPTLDFQRKKNSEAVTEDLERQKPFSKEEAIAQLLKNQDLLQESNGEEEKQQ